jgi:FkbM family methyltransferase
VSDAVARMLSDLDIHPVLADIGSSGLGPAPWRQIAAESVYLGFDPDAREPEAGASSFGDTRVVRKAVTADSVSKVGFHLTRSPHCSSSLEPDSASLSPYLFADLFDVVGTEEVEAVTLNDALDAQGLDGPDWIKIDSQGTDLRLFASLADARRSRLIAVDVEPGLIDAYKGEDLFVDTHARLLREGFWPSRFIVQGAARIRASRADELLGRGLTREDIETSLRPSPGWIEARYLSTVDRVREAREARGPALLWAFAMLDDQPGFAYEVAREFRSGGLEPSVATAMEDAAVNAIVAARGRRRRKRLAAVPARAARRLGRLLGTAGT